MRRLRRLGSLAVSLSLLLGACSARLPGTLTVPRGAQVGQATWYGKRHEGRRTASGERFDADAMTAAHPTAPFGTRLKVTNLKNGKSVVVRVNDRGPFGGGRIIDLSSAAARALGITRGVGRVKVERLRSDRAVSE